MTVGRRFFRTAVGFEIIEHARNRLAIVLVLVFIPLWITMIRLTASTNLVPFLYRGDNRLLRVETAQIIYISGGLNVVTLILGFLMFSVTYRSGPFDRRLVAAGFPRLHLLLAKGSALVVSATVVSLYATAVVILFWRPEQPWLLGVGLFTSALTYGGIGIVLGVVLRGELEGMFAIIMISIVDVALENPVTNPASDQDLVRYLPMYGSMQAGVGAGFTDDVPWRQMLAVLAWWAGCMLIGVVAYYLRTRVYTRQARALPRVAAQVPAALHPGPQEAVHVTVRVCGPSCVATDHMSMPQGLAVLAALTAEQAAASQNVYPLGLRARQGPSSAG